MKIMVLAGGSDQCALISELQCRGHEVLLLDYLDNPPAKSLVLKHIQASTLDVDAVRMHAIDESVELICTACTDQALLTVAKVSEDLGLPCYLPFSTALNVTNKSYMKKKMIESDIPTSKYVNIHSLMDLKDNFNLEYPIVVKPADCNSSKGVKKVNNYVELERYLIEALNFSRTNTAIIEEYKDGKEISADFYISEGKPLFLSASESFKIPNQTGFTILGSNYEPLLENDVLELSEIARKIAKAFNIYEAPLLIQLIKSKTGFSVIEFSARMGGGSKYYLINEIAGINIISDYVNLILGIKPVIKPKISSSYIKMVYVYCYPGRVQCIKGLEELKSSGIIKEYFIYKTPGCYITKAETSSDRVLGYMVRDEDIESLNKKIEIVDSTLKVINSLGSDIMIHNLLH